MSSYPGVTVQGKLDWKGLVFVNESHLLNDTLNLSIFDNLALANMSICSAKSATYLHAWEIVPEIFSCEVNISFAF